MIILLWNLLNHSTQIKFHMEKIEVGRWWWSCYNSLLMHTVDWLWCIDGDSMEKSQRTWRFWGFRKFGTLIFFNGVFQRFLVFLFLVVVVLWLLCLVWRWWLTEVNDVECSVIILWFEGSWVCTWCLLP
jgi:hypothetical protein